MDDENRDGLAELGTCFHDPEAEGDDFGGEEEVDYVGIVVLLPGQRAIFSPRILISATYFDEGTNDAERREAEVLERPCLARGVEEWIEEQRDVC